MEDLASLIQSNTFYIANKNHFQNLLRSLLSGNTDKVDVVFSADFTPEEKAELMGRVVTEEDGVLVEEVNSIIGRLGAPIKRVRVSSVKDVADIPAGDVVEAVIVDVDDTMMPDDYIRVCKLAGVRGFYVGTGCFRSDVVFGVPQSASLSHFPQLPPLPPLPQLPALPPLPPIPPLPPLPAVPPRSPSVVSSMLHFATEFLKIGAVFAAGVLIGSRGKIDIAPKINILKFDIFKQG